jgi:putative tryptophan/tyrosine transport system substrate-binding protein
MKRREFITVLGGAAAAWPHAARAQQRERMRRIGALMAYTANDPQAQIRNAAFLQGLQQLGWIVGQNVQIDYRFSGGNIDDTRRYAAELVALSPDVIFAPGSSALGPLLQVSRSVPIVFAIVIDPVGSGFVNNMARPGGNATGFTAFDYGIGAKWLEVLKEIAPNVTRAAVIRDPAIAAGLGMWAAIQSVSPSVAIEVSPINMTDAGEIERAVAAFAHGPNGSLIVTGSALTVVHRDHIIALAARYKLPAVYYEDFYVAAGGLVSYGADNVDQFRRAAGYVDRMLKGEKAGDLPVDFGTKFDLVINLATAKAFGVEIPPKLIALADEVIE